MIESPEKITQHSNISSHSPTHQIQSSTQKKVALTIGNVIEEIKLNKLLSVREGILYLKIPEDTQISVRKFFLALIEWYSRRNQYFDGFTKNQIDNKNIFQYLFQEGSVLQSEFLGKEIPLGILRNIKHSFPISIKKDDGMQKVSAEFFKDEHSEISLDEILFYLYSKNIRSGYDFEKISLILEYFQGSIPEDEFIQINKDQNYPIQHSKNRLQFIIASDLFEKNMGGGEFMPIQISILKKDKTFSFPDGKKISQIQKGVVGLIPKKRGYQVNISGQKILQKDFSIDELPAGTFGDGLSFQEKSTHYEIIAEKDGFLEFSQNGEKWGILYNSVIEAEISPDVSECVLPYENMRILGDIEGKKITFLGKKIEFQGHISNVKLHIPDSSTDIKIVGTSAGGFELFVGETTQAEVKFDTLLPNCKIFGNKISLVVSQSIQHNAEIVVDNLSVTTLNSISYVIAQTFQFGQCVVGEKGTLIAGKNILGNEIVLKGDEKVICIAQNDKDSEFMIQLRKKIDIYQEKKKKLSQILIQLKNELEAKPEYQKYKVLFQELQNASPEQKLEKAAQVSQLQAIISQSLKNFSDTKNKYLRIEEEIQKLLSLLNQEDAKIQVKKVSGKTNGKVVIKHADISGDVKQKITALKKLSQKSPQIGEINSGEHIDITL